MDSTPLPETSSAPLYRRCQLQRKAPRLYFVVRGCGDGSDVSATTEAAFVAGKDHFLAFIHFLAFCLSL